MTLWLLTCYGRMRHNVLTFFHRKSLVALTCHGRAHHNEYFWFSGFLFLATVSLCSGVQGLRVYCIYCFLGILGILSGCSILFGVPISVCGEGEVVVIVPEISPHPSKARWTAAWHHSVYYPGCAGHRKPTLNTCLSNITKVYNLLSTIEMSGSSSPD